MEYSNVFFLCGNPKFKYYHLALICPKLCIACNLHCQTNWLLRGRCVCCCILYCCHLRNYKLGPAALGLGGRSVSILYCLSFR
jgi:hypothetical protein